MQSRVVLTLAQSRESLIGLKGYDSPYINEIKIKLQGKCAWTLLVVLNVKFSPPNLHILHSLRFVALCKMYDLTHIGHGFCFNFF